MTTMTNKLYFDKKVLKDEFLRAINTLDKDSIYTKEISKLTNKLKSYLEGIDKHSKKRFIKIKNSDVTLDLYTKCLWPNLFEELDEEAYGMTLAHRLKRLKKLCQMVGIYQLNIS